MAFLDARRGLIDMIGRKRHLPPQYSVSAAPLAGAVAPVSGPLLDGTFGAGAYTLGCWMPVRARWCRVFFDATFGVRKMAQGLGR